VHGIDDDEPSDAAIISAPLSKIKNKIVSGNVARRIRRQNGCARQDVSKTDEDNEDGFKRMEDYFR
jgi:hypothetical protein